MTKLDDLKAQAEIDKITAERDFFNANARVATALAEQEEIALRVRTRAEKDVLNRNEYHNVYVFDRDVDDNSVKECIQTITRWVREDAAKDGTKRAIEIQLNTNGGSIFAGFALIDFIRDLSAKGHEVTITVFGVAASMGAVILQAADKRVMGENAFLLIHEGSMFAGGDFGHVEDEYNLMNKLHDRILGLLTDKATISKQTVKKNWRRKDWWMASDEAIKHGLVDEVR